MRGFSFRSPGAIFLSLLLFLVGVLVGGDLNGAARAAGAPAPAPTGKGDSVPVGFSSNQKMQQQYPSGYKSLEDCSGSTCYFHIKVNENTASASPPSCSTSYTNCVSIDNAKMTQDPGQCLKGRSCPQYASVVLEWTP
jgi:hypothetical protein